MRQRDKPPNSILGTGGNGGAGKERVNREETRKIRNGKRWPEKKNLRWNS